MGEQQSLSYDGMIAVETRDFSQYETLLLKMAHIGPEIVTRRSSTVFNGMNLTGWNP